MRTTLVFIALAIPIFLFAGCGGDTKYVEPECGNDEREGLEVCDGTDLEGRSCTDLGYTGGTLLCTGACMAFDVSHCTGEACGNGTLDIGEACDGEDLGTATCTSLGFDSGTLACATTCDGYDTSDCEGEGCGNGVIEDGEQCDGEDLADQTCETLGEDPGNLGCGLDCTFDTSYCGCTPDCTGRECGDDGCSGSCGSCTEPETCNVMGQCLCLPDCTDRECGDDGCSGSCGSCTFPETCTEAGTCECVPDCTDRECGDDGCSGSCGSCTEPDVCVELTGTCTCFADCTGRECGDDGCGGSCGSCTEPDVCVELTGTCTCFADCTDRECGDDGCGGSCGSCTDPDVCSSDGTCVCIPDCTGRECGPDGCSGSCGSCTDGEACNGSGICVCVPSCTGRECGPDGCGGSCGSCDGEEVCNASGVCVCAPDCVGRECGDDGCGGSCGSCTAGEVCNASGVCVCVPSCAGRVCGDDGCGGVCGTCAFPLVCSAGACVQPPGDVCSNAFVITAGSLPAVRTGDTRDASDDYGFVAGQCAGVSGDRGGASADEVYSLTPAATGIYTITLTPDGSYDPVLYLLTSCTAPMACVRASDLAGVETITATLTAGTTYYIVVDGWDNVTNVSGTYTLRVGAPCVPDCAGRECGTDGCGGSCGTCPVGETCDVSGFCETIEGDTCEDPFLVDARFLPFVASGDTTDAFNQYFFANDACPGESDGRGAMSNDEVYEFVPMVTGMYTITVTPAADFDPTVYVVSDCASVDTSCIGANQEWGDGLVEVLDVVLTAGTAYYVIVDGWTNYSEDSGTYTIEISPVCTPDCAGRQCGTDGCMGSCGTCTGGLLCDPTGHCVISITGDVCPTPFVVAPGSLPYAGAGDTSDAMNDYSFASSVCPGVTYACGGGSKDEVFRFMPTASGTYTITVDPTFDSVLYVVTNCTSITSLTCLGAEDAVGSAPEVLSLGLTAGTTYYIIVDGYTTSSDLSGPYTITLTSP